jgi:hypothetical protein
LETEQISFSFAEDKRQTTQEFHQRDHNGRHYRKRNAHVRKHSSNPVKSESRELLAAVNQKNDANDYADYTETPGPQVRAIVHSFLRPIKLNKDAGRTTITRY